MYNVVAIILVITAFAAYINHRWIRVPTAIGLMGVSLFVSLILIALDFYGVSDIRDYEHKMMASIDFSGVVMQGMLSILLFAGALHADLSSLKDQKWEIGVMATVGVLLSTFMVGYGLHYASEAFGYAIPLIYCLVFGALISPTDPIAVMGIIKDAGAPRDLEATIAGESLFNDGVGVVLFAVLLSIAVGGVNNNASSIAIKFIQEGFGGLLFGATLGIFALGMLRTIDNYSVELLITIATVLGGYAAASALHTSGPLAMVVCGLVIGNHGETAMSEKTREHIDTFWELIDEILNSVLFVLIGLEIVVLTYTKDYAVLAMMAICITLVARYFSFIIPSLFFTKFSIFNLPKGSWKILTWGGLRGGISVALALSLPSGAMRDTILAITYGVVVFSVLFQGLTVRSLVESTLRHSELKDT